MKKVQYAKWGKNKLQILWLNFAINQNGSSGENSYLRGKLRNNPVLVYGENLWEIFMGIILLNRYCQLLCISGEF
jgi:hypothetical protein